MVPLLFVARHDQHFIMFKDSHILPFTNFLLKTKHNNTVVFPVNCKYLFSKEKQEKIVEKTLWLNLLCNILNIRQNSMILEGSPDSLTEFYFPRKLRLGESYFTGELGLGEF